MNSKNVAKDFNFKMGGKINWDKRRQLDKIDHYFEEIELRNKITENYYKNKMHSKTKINLGIHENHDWEIVRDVPAPHSGKIICNTCGGKWVTWLPKGTI